MSTSDAVVANGGIREFVFFTTEMGRLVHSSLIHRFSKVRDRFSMFLTGLSALIIRKYQVCEASYLRSHVRQKPLGHPCPAHSFGSRRG